MQGQVAWVTASWHKSTFHSALASSANSEQVTLYENAAPIIITSQKPPRASINFFAMGVGSAPLTSVTSR